MRSGWLIVLLTVGTVVGFATGFHHMREMHHMNWEAQEQHFANLCAEAAKRACEAPPAPAPPPVAPHAPQSGPSF